MSSADRFFIVHEPGKVPRIGFPMGNFDESVDGWIHDNPTAEIYIVSWFDRVPRPGTVHVELASEYVHIREAMKDADIPAESEREQS